MTEARVDTPLQEQTMTVPVPDPGVHELAPRFLEPNSFVLDAGTGIGRNAIYIARLGHRVLAIDSSEEYLERANKYTQLIPEELDVEFVTHSITQFGLPERDFDSVFITKVLQELASEKDAREAVADMQAVTREGGSNIVTVAIGTDSDREAVSRITILEPGQAEAMYEDEGWHIAHRRQELKEPGFYDGKTTCRSYVELVAVKPEE